MPSSPARAQATATTNLNQDLQTYVMGDFATKSGQDGESSGRR